MHYPSQFCVPVKTDTQKLDRFSFFPADGTEQPFPVADGRITEEIRNSSRLGWSHLFSTNRIASLMKDACPRTTNPIKMQMHECPEIKKNDRTKAIHTQQQQQPKGSTVLLCAKTMLIGGLLRFQTIAHPRTT